MLSISVLCSSLLPILVGLLVGAGVGAFRDLVSNLAKGMYPHTIGKGSRGNEFFFNQVSI